MTDVAVHLPDIVMGDPGVPGDVAISCDPKSIRIHAGEHRTWVQSVYQSSFAASGRTAAVV